MSGTQSPRAVRLVDEALGDWRHEVDRAATPFSRVVAHGRGLGGVVRVAIAIAPEVLQVPLRPRWLLSLVLATGAVVGPMDTARLSRMVSGDLSAIAVAALIWPLLVGVLGYVLALALLIGPSRGPSPLPAFVSAAVVNVAAFYVIWPRMIQVVWLQRGGSPGEPLDAFPLSMALFGVAYSVLAIAIAERVRVDRRRMIITVQCGLMVIVVIAGLWMNNTIGRALGLPNTHHVFMRGPMFVGLLVPGAFWLSLRRRQHRDAAHASA